MFERADTAPGDDHGSSCVGGDSRQVDLAEVYGRLGGAWSLLRLWYLHADVQLKAVIPDQAACPAVFRQINGQHQRWTTLSHWQDHPAMFTRDGLRRPLDRIEVFRAPGVLHLHLGVSPAKLASRLDVGEESGDDHLDRLTMQRETPFCRFLQNITSRPFRMAGAGGLVRFQTGVPYLRCLHLSSLAALELAVRQVMQLVDFHRFHDTIVSWMKVVY